jgi:sialate O-acetylesterase
VAIATLNYDDGLDVHLRDVIPALDQRGLKASFFIANYQGEDHNWALPNLTDPLNARHLAWQAAVANGHELSAHTVFHPCDAGHLASYTMQQMEAELDDNIARLERLGATAPFTFGYPCLAENGIGNPNMDMGPLVEARFIASRKSPNVIADPATVDFYTVPNVEPLGQTGEQLCGLVDDAIAQQGWVQFGFHGVGQEQSSCPQGLDYDPQACAINYQATPTDAHEALLDCLVAKQAQVWTATFKEAVLCLQSRRN